ncbi:CvpA family protein [Acetobacter orleanensis]|uniref:Colicin V production protein CvpA n=1 Tax=Acetobacter orleanensis TaxID=104099 RepID=A0A4Y3TKD6_9PROT|nr:CvpA family protein [Acetobacter orleanensis]KXV62738.1 bacteriocin biosynthesis protein [Acetobacter orleanensis]PCD79258.1 bacteriocin biosynthesis protein [Acetobacter orleanensis]GAN67871.1 bacteriocin/colicin V production [Acetobacter orleanensis JCM 7639]GBR24186.1 bacteriocin/colicin V production CvpA [Acetobacter orleanensis NRIC 0473]GEB83451.1 colicin V production protein CvpA [Acetobacter orleanensis]
MAAIDSIALVIVGLSALHGFWRGFTRQALGLGGWILAILLACRFYPLLIPWTQPYLFNHLAAGAAAFAILLIGLLIAVSLLSSIIVRLVHLTALSGLDRTLGCGFGVIRGGLLVVLIFLAAQWLMMPEDMASLEANGRLTPYIRAGAAYIQPFLPVFSAKGVAPNLSTGHDATL